MNARQAEADRMLHAAVGKVPAHTLPTFHAILRFRRAGRGAWPRQEWIGQQIGRDQRTVRRHVAALVAAGVLDVDRSRPHHDPGTGQWRRRTNRYRCRFPPKKPGQTPRRAAPSPRGHARPVNVPTGTPGSWPTPPVGGGSPPVPPSGPRETLTGPPRWFLDQADRLRRGQRNTP